MRFGAFLAARCALRRKNLRAANDSTARGGPAGLTMRERDGAFCIDPEQARGIVVCPRSSSIQNHGTDCAAAVRVR